MRLFTLLGLATFAQASEDTEVAPLNSIKPNYTERFIIPKVGIEDDFYGFPKFEIDVKTRNIIPSGSVVLSDLKVIHAFNILFIFNLY